MSAVRRLVAALAIATPQAAFAASLGGGAAPAISPWRVVGSLLLCLALGAGAILLLRRRYGLGQSPLPGAAARRIRVIEQQGLGPQRSLSLIEVDRRTYLALIAPGAATLVPVGERSAPPTPSRELGERLA